MSIDRTKKRSVVSFGVVSGNMSLGSRFPSFPGGTLILCGVLLWINQATISAQYACVNPCVFFFPFRCEDWLLPPLRRYQVLRGACITYRIYVTQGIEVAPTQIVPYCDASESKISIGKSRTTYL